MPLRGLCLSTLDGPSFSSGASEGQPKHEPCTDLQLHQNSLEQLPVTLVTIHLLDHALHKLHCMPVMGILLQRLQSLSGLQNVLNAGYNVSFMTLQSQAEKRHRFQYFCVHGTANQYLRPSPLMEISLQACTIACFDRPVFTKGRKMGNVYAISIHHTLQSLPFVSHPPCSEASNGTVTTLQEMEHLFWILYNASTMLSSSRGFFGDFS